MTPTVLTVPLSARQDDDAIDAWTGLADRAAEPNPFFRPEFVLPSVEGRDDGGFLLVVQDADRWIGCLPLRRARGWRRHPWPVLTNWLPQYTYLATPLVDGDAVGPAAAGIAAFLRAERRAAAAVLEPLYADSPVARALSDALTAAGLRARVYAEHERAALSRRPEPTYLEEAASSKRRKEWRRQRRALERDVGPVAVADRSSDPAAFDLFLEMERASWKGEMGTALGDRQADAAFFRAMLERCGPEGLAQVLELRAGDRVAAMQVNLTDGGSLFGFKVAYDDDLRRFGPGALLEVEALSTFHDRSDLLRADSCAAPDNQLMNSLWPDRRRVQTWLVPTGAPLAKLVRPFLGAERAARRAVRAARAARVAVRERRR